MAVGYFEAFIKIWNHCFVEWEVRGPRKTFLKDFFNDVSSYGFISANDILLCLFLGFLFTILRYLLTIAVFKPTFKWFKLLEKDQEKCPESAFKLLFYSSAYGYCSYILFNGKYDFFHDTDNCWKGWYKGMPIPQDIYTLYVVEAGFYFHSIYATVFMDQWRKDSILMILHHVLTNLLIFFSFAIRYHRIGVIVLFLHDINDVFLEFSKLCVAFRTRNGKYHRISDILSSVGFLTFTASWFYCRLYLYPIKVLYSCGCGARPYMPLTAPFYFFFNAMLWILFGMNLWWFQYMVLLLIRIVTGMSHSVEDVREIPKNKMVNGKTVQNGDVSTGDNVNYAMQSSCSSKEDNKRRDEHVDHITEKENKEQFRRRQPRTKPANP